MTARFSRRRLKLLGSGSALPGESVGNDELLQSLSRHCGERTAKLGRKIVSRLGITSRHLSRDLQLPLSGSRPGMDAPTLCRNAVNSAVNGRQISFLIGHTATPHTQLPPNIAWVADSLRYAGPYTEIRQACTGFASALTFAAALIAEDDSEQVCIVGSETGSPYFEISRNFTDREQLINFVQMGDGAGAAIFAAHDGEESQTVSDIFAGQIGTGMSPGISIAGGGSANPFCEKGLPYFRHDAQIVAKKGQLLIEQGIQAITGRGHRIGDFDWILPHQANGHMAELFANRYPECRGKVYVTADRLGNLGSAAIWVSLDKLRQSGRLQRGERVLVLGAEASKYLYGGFVYTH